MQEKHPNSNGTADSKAGPKAEDFFAVALAARGRLLEGEPSVLKIQVLPLRETLDASFKANHRACF